MGEILSRVNDAAKVREAVSGTVTTAVSTARSGAILASRTLAYVGVSNPAGFHGTVTEAVIRDVTTGRLDFVYQVHTDATATEGATRFTTNPFALRTAPFTSAELLEQLALPKQPGLVVCCRKRPGGGLR